MLQAFKCQGIFSLEPMPSTRDRIERLEKRVGSLEGPGSRVLHLGNLGAENQSVPWWAKALLGVLAAAFFSYTGWLGVEVYNDNARLSRIEQRLSDFGDALHQMQESLKSVYSSISLRKIADLKPKELAEAMPTLRKLIKEYPSGVNPDPQTLKEIAWKLGQTRDSSPGYWTTVLQFIEFASSSTVTPTDVPPPGTPYSVISNMRCTGIVHCIKASHRAIVLDGGDIPGSIFSHCRIKFTNNPVKLDGTKFIDCIFEMPVTISHPSPYLKRAAKLLLASGFSSVSFPSS